MTRIWNSSEDLARGLNAATAEGARVDGDKVYWEVSIDAAPTFLVNAGPSFQFAPPSGFGPLYKFDPAAPISDLAARLLAASNGLHSHPVDGTPPAEVGASRHAWKP